MKPLLALLLVVLAGCRSAVTESARLDAGTFEDVTDRVGVAFRHFNGATGEYYLPEIMGPGVAAFDYDGDGDLDLYFVQGDFIDAGKTMADATFPMPAGWERGGRLFRNELVPSGTLRFVDATATSGIQTDFYGMGVAVGDFDNDTRPDLVATGLGRTDVYRNLGGGRFENVAKGLGVVDPDLGTSAAFVDVDRDGWLDLFVVHYVHGTTVERKKCRNPAALLDYCGPQAFSPAIARLYRNEQGRAFRDVTQSSGVGAAAGPGLGVLITDVNADGWPDIYVANDGAASFLWVNQKNSTFVESALEMGVAYSIDGKAQAGMGIAAGDVDNDGTEEILKTNLRREGANLYKRDASGAYRDVAGAANVFVNTFRGTGFGVGLADFDNDGWQDAFFANGGVIEMESQRGQPYPYRQPNVLLRNDRGVFAMVPANVGPLAAEEVSRGVAFGDFDNDGAVDMALAINNGRARVYRNTRGGPPAHWLRVRAHTATGLTAIGAMVRVETASGLKLTKRIEPSGSYLSSSDPSAHFGLGRDSRVTSLAVEWPDGSRTSHSVAGIDRELVIRRASKPPS